MDTKNIKMWVVLALILSVGYVQAAPPRVTINCDDLQLYPADQIFTPYETHIRPDNGWYNGGWHGDTDPKIKNEGWGLNIEIQIGSLSNKGYLFGAAFVPDKNGEPTWRTFNGPITLHNPNQVLPPSPMATFRGDMWTTTGGMCIECGENIPGESVLAEEGSITIEWHDNRNATLKWAGKSIEIAHWQWADNIGVDHSDWIVGTWLVNGDLYFQGVHSTQAPDGPAGDSRVRFASVAKIAKASPVPPGLDNKGWSVYVLTTKATPIKTSSEQPTFGGGSFERTEYIAYIPESDTWELYYYHAVKPGVNLSDTAYPVLKLFVQGQNRIVGVGSYDPSDAQSEEVLKFNTRLMTRVSNFWKIGDMVLPPASRAAVCE